MSTHRLVSLFVLAVVLTAVPLHAQSAADKIVEATDFSVPTVPAFVLLDVNPAAVTRPGLVKDFNIDLLVKDGALAPDLALEARPVWVLGFSDVSRAEYARMSYLRRTLSTLSVSLGTVARESTQELAWATRMSLLRPDPLLDAAYLADVGVALAVTAEEDRLRTEREDRLLRARTAADTARVLEWFDTALDALIASRDRDRLTEIRAAVQSFQKRTWNAPAIDIGLGQVFQYEGAALETLDFQESGFGAWLSAGWGFGTERWLFTGLAKWVDLSEDADVALGANARFGGTRLNGFVEYVWSGGAADGDTNTIAYGGEFQFTSNRVLEFGIRTELDNGLTVRHIRPVVKLRWELGETNLTRLLGN